MKLWPVENSTIPVIADWLGRKENYQWLDFGNGSQVLTATSLKVMTQRDTHLVRLFTADKEPEGEPVGVVALSNISRSFKTATIWYVLGNKSYGGKGYTTRAVAEMLSLGFGELGLEAVNAWVVEQNSASIRVLERNNFRLTGRQRKCHYIEGQAYDRLWFDILACEHKKA